MSAVRREWDYDSSALDQLMENTKDLRGRLEAFNFLDNKSKSSMDERVRAVGAPVSGGVNGSAQGMDGTSNVMMQVVCFWYSLSIISTCNIYI